MKKLVAEIKNNGEVLMSLDNDIVLVSFGALDRGNVSDTINWGVYSNVGQIYFFDANNSFKTIIESYPNVDVCIYYYFKNRRKLLATFKVDDYEINDENKSVSLKLKDILMAWQSQDIEEYYKFDTKSMSQIWGEKYSSEMIATDDAFSKMSRMLVDISYLKKDNKWRNADKFCQASMMRCFCDENGTPIISDERQINSNLIVIRPQNILSIENKTSKRKTKIQSLSISAPKYNRMIEQPLSQDLPFTLYNTRGVSSIGPDGPVENYIVGEWAQDFSNVSTRRLLSLDGYSEGYYGARVFGNIKLPEHFFRYRNSDITVNVSTSSRDSTKITKTIFSTNDFKVENYEYQKYNPDSATISYPDYKNEAEIVLDDYSVISDYSSALDQMDLLGNRVVTNGTLNWLGDFFEEDGDQLFGSESEYSQKLQSNELIQVGSSFDGEALAQQIIDKTNDKYSDGVECVVMEVTPSKYYSKYDAEVIDPESSRPLFEKYNAVIPYVVRNGVEQPYSTNDDGTPKIFKVVGIEYYYKGFLRQKLHLQERTTEPVYIYDKPTLKYVLMENNPVLLFYWDFELLGAYSEYNISWCVKKEITQDINIYQGAYEGYQYYTLDGSTPTFHFAGKEESDLLNIYTKATSDQYGKISIGIGYIPKENADIEKIIQSFTNNTNNIIAWRE